MGDSGLDRITLHNCRPTFASLLIEAGEDPKAVQEFMGHSTIAVTFDLYGTCSPAAATRLALGWTLTSKPSWLRLVDESWTNEHPRRRPEATRGDRQNRMGMRDFAL